MVEEGSVDGEVKGREEISCITDGEGRPQILLRGKNNRTTLKEVDVKEERLERVWKENIQRKEIERYYFSLPLFLSPLQHVIVVLERQGTHS